MVDPPERATPDRNTTDRNTEPHSDAGRGVGDAGAPRIVFAAHALTRATGGSRAGADILAALLATGRPVTLLSPDRPQLPATLDGEVLGRPRWLRAPPELRFPAWRGSARLISWLRSVAGWLLRTARGGPRRLSLRRRLRVEPPRLVVFNGLPWPGAFMTRLLAPLHPSLMVVHSPPDSVRYFAARDAHFTPAVVARSMRPFDHYVFVSARVRDAWQAELGIPPEACTVVHNCCREDEALAARARGRAEARRSLGWPEDAFVALCLASVSERKGQDVLLAAWHGVLRDAPGSLALVVGDDRSAWARALRERAERELPGSVRFLGQRDDVFMLLRAADVMVLPSRAEALPLAILEAMAVGTAVVASDVGGVSEVITDRRSGLLVAAGDADALAAALGSLAGDAALRERLAREARERYHEHFSRAGHARKYAAVLDRLLGPARG